MKKNCTLLVIAFFSAISALMAQTPLAHIAAFAALIVKFSVL